MQKLLYATGGLVALLILIGLALPEASRVVVTTDIDAPRATVFAQINDPQRTELWRSVKQIDPRARIEYSGPARGPGATASWEGAVAGSGTRTIVESTPFESVELRLNGGEPGESRSTFELVPDDGDTRVTWRFEHRHGMNIVARYMGIAVGGVIRRDLEAALANLKSLAESLPGADWGTLEIETLELEPLTIAFVTVTSEPDTAAVSRALGDAYFNVLSYIARNELAASGAPLAIRRQFVGGKRRIDAAIPVNGVDDDTPDRDGKVALSRTYGGTVVRAAHRGPYDRLAETHRRMAAYLAATGLQRAGDPWEAYVTDPAEVADSDLLTYVYYPVRDR